MPNEAIKVCPSCSEPVVFTFEYSGNEYFCVACGWKGSIFAPMSAPATEELIARHDELSAEYEQSRGLESPNQDRIRPSCGGCGAVATGRLDHDGKPAHWYSRTRDGVTEYACSRSCISEGAVMPW